ncbi:MAG: ATP-binding protein [Bdellovibrionales bacterium]
MAVNRLESWTKNKWMHHGVRLLFATLITVLLYPFKLDLLEYTSYDWRMQLSPKPATSGQIVLLSIEHETMKSLKREPEALDWALVLQKIAQAKPAQVVTLINPAQIQGSYDDLSMLAEVAARLPIQFGKNDLPSTGVARFDPLPAPFENLPVEAAPKTADRTVLAKDGVTRRLILTYEDHFTLHPTLAAAYNGVRAVADYQGAFQFLDSTQVLIRYRKKGSYPTIKFKDLIEGDVDPRMIEGKIVLIGRDTLESAADYVTTPLSKDLLALSQLEMNANALDTLILNQAPRFTPDWVRMALTFIISLLTIYIVLYVRPAQGLMLLAVSLGSYLLFSLAMFAALGWVVPVAHPLVAVFICYYFVIPYRLIVENRRSWEYYQKNRLLTQVEELKSNFLRMMSHDLKTPLARIQGMAEMIRQEAPRLNDNQQKALDTISESSEELTDFIASILSLSRIESKELKLQLRSRDINQILRDCIAKHLFLANRKNIEIVAEQEPLFSIKVDENLIKTVFSNLIENAIKYSPDNTKILVSSEEQDGEIVIQVADQGRGIPEEEQANIFDRFFRARNSRTNTVGNGLGLYLAKYFVELHQGRIEVESELERGSTFTVRLPLDLGAEDELQETEIREEMESEGGLHV